MLETKHKLVLIGLIFSYIQTLFGRRTLDKLRLISVGLINAGVSLLVLLSFLSNSYILITN